MGNEYEQSVSGRAPKIVQATSAWSQLQNRFLTACTVAAWRLAALLFLVLLPSMHKVGLRRRATVVEAC